jgi:hypothetical protein
MANSLRAPCSRTVNRRIISSLGSVKPYSLVLQTYGSDARRRPESVSRSVSFTRSPIGNVNLRRMATEYDFSRARSAGSCEMDAVARRAAAGEFGPIGGAVVSSIAAKAESGDAVVCDEADSRHLSRSRAGEWRHVTVEGLAPDCYCPNCSASSGAL